MVYSATSATSGISPEIQRLRLVYCVSLCLCQPVTRTGATRDYYKGKVSLPSQGLSQHARVAFVECRSECRHGGV